MRNDAATPAPERPPRRSLLRRYLVTFLAVVAVPLVAYAVAVLGFTADEHRRSLAEVQRVHAEAAAQRITQFVRELEGQLRWTTHIAWSEADTEQHRVDALRLLRQAPAVTDVTLLDGAGRERLFVSRLSMDRRVSAQDRSAEPAFRGARNGGVYYGPVYFRRDTEPYMTLALSGPRSDASVTIAEINLKYVRDVVAGVRVGRQGRAYAVDRTGRLIAHAEAGLVLRNTDLSALLQRIDAQPSETLHRANGLEGEPVMVAQALAPPLDWRVLVELPQSEADEPLSQALARSLWVAAASLAGALLFAIALSWRMIRPIRALTTGAARIGAGQLDHRIAIRTGDELERLGDQFNAMAGELERVYAGLESKVAERTRELSDANLAKSRFVAAASHDLRQPLHALNLLVAQLRTETDAAAQQQLKQRIESAVSSINGLFDGLLDISKLDAGGMRAQVCEFALQPLLDRMEAAFAADMQAKGLRLRVRPTSAWVRSDPVLLERIVSNLVGNALRYSRCGGVLLGCRRRGTQLQIEVVDTGVGIAADKHEQIFTEFYQVAPAGALRGEGLGLGLAIVARLCRLLGHEIGLRSEPGRGSRFTVRVAEAPPQAPTAPTANCEAPAFDVLRGHRVLVVDNDPDVLASSAGLLRSWGLAVHTAASVGEALQAVQHAGDVAWRLVIADLHLGGGTSGLDAVAAVRAATHVRLAALIVSGDVSQAARDSVAAQGLTLLEKPVPPMRLRALVTRALTQG
jgi:signal transduction histidine kinase